MAVIDQAAKKRLQRRWRRRQAEAAKSVVQADDKIERLLILRIDRLMGVRRFVSLWLLLFVALIAASYLQLRALSPTYQSLVPIPGGLYSEGVIGKFSNANPLFASGAADTAASSLIFSGLFKYNNQNRLVGDLATGYDLNSDQTRYTVHLRHGVTWQDGRPFT
ncbi:MAG TPA: ABC transporter substrate-binding protein, partial [Candidatus Saccharimonadales bacterium]|nr:ABC transporter substrate-binding protein [Candidatus Saccharimonadales bacterium]